MRYPKTIATTVTALGALGYAGLNATAQVGTASRAHLGTYRLTELGGRPLPALLEEENGCREELLGATLTLAAGGTWTLTTVERESCGAAAEQEEEVERGTYTVSGSTLTLADDDADDAEDDADDVEFDVDEPRSAMLTGDALTVRLSDERTILVFRR